jgi:hypothetical protein
MLLDNRPPAGELIHKRAYDVEVYREGANVVRMRGTLVDEKPAGLHFDDDPAPLTIHRMVVDVLVELPSTTILDVDVVFDSHPHEQCPRVIPSYRALVGVPIARGFSRRVRELFGGPHGCTHTTALIQAMAPVIVQSAWSMRVLEDREQPVELRDRPMADAHRQAWVSSVDTCHVWAADGEHVAQIEAGEPIPPPQQYVARAEALGVPPERWRRQFEL